MTDPAARSHESQAVLTSALAGRAFEALGVLLRGFEDAAERDGTALLDDALARGPEHLYGGLLTALLRIVFLLYAEDRGLLPIEHPRYAEHLGVLSLFHELEQARRVDPGALARRYGAWARLLALFRAVFHGVEHGDLRLPARRGELFDPERYPFLEGGPTAARPPAVDDGAVRDALEKLLVLDGQRLSYRALEVEHLGNLYEALMGYRVERAAGPTVCLRPDRAWISAAALLAQPRARRAAWLADAAGLSRREAAKLGAALAAATTAAEIVEALGPLRVREAEVRGAGRLFLQPGAERRRTSSHYTPRSLSAPIVERTLEPLLRSLGDEPPSEGLLDLAICDPAMGSGAFLLEACRFLADQVVAAWTREAARGGVLAARRLAGAREDSVSRARRLVARRCLYGADKNPFAVSLAKLSLWLEARADGEPFTFVDRALRHGDSLVGLDLDQLRAFHYDRRAAPLPLCREAIDEAIALRRQPAPRPDGDHAPAARSQAQRSQAQRSEAQRSQDAEQALVRARLLGDLAVGAFFAHARDRDRQKERELRAALVTAWLTRGGPPPDELLQMQRELREGTPGERPPIPPLHWPLEFPEVFADDGPGDGGRPAARLRAFVGNPPFLGGKRISTDHGDLYAAWLEQLHDATRNTDLAAHFFRRADALLGPRGTVGLVATNTIAQGDTRRAGLMPLVATGRARIYHALRSLPWPGDAAVHVAVVHLAVGMPPRGDAAPRLDGRPVEHINSFLRAMPERPDPRPLRPSVDLCFIGCFLRGDGFVLTEDERRALLDRGARTAPVLRSFLGGEEVNTSPTHSPHRYVIDFGERGLEEAAAWPELLSILRERVKPERDRLKGTGVDAGHRARWWQFANTRPELRRKLSSLSRCLVAARVTKHLSFAFQPPDRTFSDQLCVFALDDHARFAVLQSRVHEAWARLLSSTMGEGLRYAPSDCVETFPFPSPEHLGPSGRLEAAGERLYAARARHMVESREGLTATYNLLKDPSCRAPRVVELRGLHEELDREVLHAYGFDDISVPPYRAPVAPDERQALAAFEDRVIDRLFALNEERAAREERP